MVKLCICQICTCGRHHCPLHANKPYGGGNGQCTLSEYTNRYHKHPIEPNPSYKPDAAAFSSDAPLQDDTTHRVDYVKHPLDKPFVRDREVYQKPEGPMDGLTSYKKEYTEKPVAPTKSMKRPDRKSVPGKFEADPTYKHDYRKWSIGPRQKIVKDDGYRPTSAPFEGQSNYRSNYIGPKQAVRASMKPVERTNASNQPFDDLTGYRQEYVKHPMPAKVQKEEQVWEPNKVPLDDLSNYRKDFVPKAGNKIPSYKPDAGAYQSDAPFQDDTTQRTDYKKWPANRPHQHVAEVWQKPDGVMDMDTTHRINYTPKPLDKVAAMKPQQRKGAPGRFDDSTNYKNDFVKWSAQPHRRKVKEEYMPPDAPFQGNSDYRDNFIKKYAPVRASMKPSEAARVSDARFDDRTGYRDEFVKHAIPERQRKEEKQWEPNRVPLDDLSNYRKDYTDKKGAKLPSYKPDAGAFQSDAPFVDDTTQRIDFKKWPVNRPDQHQREEYQKPTGDMDTNTTHRTTYTPKALAKREAMKPAPRKGAPGKFDDGTNYKNDYVKWVHQPHRPKMKEEYIPSDAPFDGNSNYRDHYTKKPGGPRASMKPSERALQSDLPFDDTTNYRTDYVKKVNKRCPAPLAEANALPFIFQDKDQIGHKFYEASGPMPEGIMTPPAYMSRQTTVA